MSLRETLIMALVIVIGLSGVVWFLATHEQVTEQAWTGLRGEAKRNPWLAAQRLVRRFGQPATELRSLPELRNLPPRATLIVPESHHTINGHLRDEIIDWVRSGGYLIVEAEYPRQKDPLVEAFGVDRYTIEFDEYEDDLDVFEESNFEKIRLPNATTPAAIELERFMSLDAKDVWFRADGTYGTYLLVKRSGRGAVTIVNDLNYAHNDGIGSLDHAQFLVDLVQLREELIRDEGIGPAPQDTPVMFFNRPGKLSLASWLGEHAWAPLAGGAAALILWLWRVIPRFGPIMPDADRKRRRLLDHLRASGRFLWSNGHATRLVEASREACLRQIARSLPHFLSATEEARIEQLVHTLGITQEQAQRILQPQEGGKMIHFWQTIRLYQRVYSRLAIRSAASGTKSA
ncbi:MAG: hypothetical protein JSU95_10435 [Betaproteobacteria bacterium]|nr:MAG: hypothetical protein JSU95_10435 [Betaproteobacteria bacterium]